MITDGKFWQVSRRKMSSEIFSHIHTLQYMVISSEKCVMSLSLKYRMQYFTAVHKEGQGAFLCASHICYGPLHNHFIQSLKIDGILVITDSGQVVAGKMNQENKSG